MTPKERIGAIRLMEKMKHHPEFSGRLGVEINIVNNMTDRNESPLCDDKTN